MQTMSLKRINSYPHLANEVPELVEWLTTYLGYGPVSRAGLLWYFRPWRSSRTRPAKSGVYATVHGDFVGFSYYSAEYGQWLMSFEKVAAAQSCADSFAKAVRKGDSAAMGVYQSWHQSKLWSAAPVDDIGEMPYWSLNRGELHYNDEAIHLAMLRQAVDPQCQRKFFTRN